MSDDQPCGAPVRLSGEACARKRGHANHHSPKATVDRELAVLRARNSAGYLARMADLEGREREKRAMAGRYQRRLAMVNAIKLTAGCADCGYDGHPAALDFDHLAGYEKSKEVASMYLAAITRLFTEIMKCEVVCANCHRIRTFSRKRKLEAG